VGERKQEIRSEDSSRKKTFEKLSIRNWGSKICRKTLWMMKILLLKKWLQKLN